MSTVRSIGKLVAALALVAAAGLALAGEPPEALGVLLLEHPDLPGTLLPGRQVLDNPARVRTDVDGAVVHLDNGQVLRFAGNSAALLAGGADGEVEVRVLSGSVTGLGAGGRIRRAGAGSRFVLRPVLTDPLQAEAALLSAARPVGEDGQPAAAEVHGRRARAAAR